MKKFLAIVLCLYSFVFASDKEANEIQNQIIYKILTAIKHKESKINVYIKCKNSTLKDNKHIKIVKEYKKADIVIIDHKTSLPGDCQVPIFTLDYNLLKEYPEAIGAFFWQKSRPNIVFISPRLKKFHILLPKEFDEYIESKIW